MDPFRNDNGYHPPHQSYGYPAAPQAPPPAGNYYYNYTMSPGYSNAMHLGYLNALPPTPAVNNDYSYTMPPSYSNAMHPGYPNALPPTPAVNNYYSYTMPPNYNNAMHPVYPNALPPTSPGYPYYPTPQTYPIHQPWHNHWQPPETHPRTPHGFDAYGHQATWPGQSVEPDQGWTNANDNSPHNYRDFGVVEVKRNVSPPPPKSPPAKPQPLAAGARGDDPVGLEKADVISTALPKTSAAPTKIKANNNQKAVAPKKLTRVSKSSNFSSGNRRSSRLSGRDLMLMLGANAR